MLFFLANNSVGRRTKHIEARYHYVRGYVEDGVVKIIFVRSDENLADIFTKSVSKEIFSRISEKLMKIDKV